MSWWWYRAHACHCGPPTSLLTLFTRSVSSPCRCISPYSLIWVAMLLPGPAELLLRSHKVGLCWVLFSGPLSGLGSSICGESAAGVTQVWASSICGESAAGVTPLHVAPGESCRWLASRELCEADLGGSFHLSRGEGGFQDKCLLASWLAGWRGQSVQAVQVYGS